MNRTEYERWHVLRWFVAYSHKENTTRKCLKEESRMVSVDSSVHITSTGDSNAFAEKM